MSIKLEERLDRVEKALIGDINDPSKPSVQGMLQALETQMRLIAQQHGNCGNLRILRMQVYAQWACIGIMALWLLSLTLYVLTGQIHLVG